MENNNVQNYKSLPSFYDNYVQIDEGIQAKIKPVLNQILECRGDSAAC